VSAPAPRRLRPRPLPGPPRPGVLPGWGGVAPGIGGAVRAPHRARVQAGSDGGEGRDKEGTGCGPQPGAAPRGVKVQTGGEGGRGWALRSPARPAVAVGKAAPREGPVREGCPIRRGVGEERAGWGGPAYLPVAQVTCSGE